eukprot:scaffold36481_cov44-Attheya_sp.AAC.3
MEIAVGPDGAAAAAAVPAAVAFVAVAAAAAAAATAAPGDVAVRAVSTQFCCIVEAGIHQCFGQERGDDFDRPHGNLGVGRGFGTGLEGKEGVRILDLVKLHFAF